MGFPGAEITYPIWIEAQARTQDAAASDWITWQSQVSPVTILALIGLFISFGMWVFRIGGRNNEIERTQKGLEALQAEVKAMSSARTTDRDGDRKERDAFMVAINAGLAATEGRVAEFKEHSAKHFATKPELLALEDRTNRGMDRIVDRLDQISGRLENIGDGILKALATR